MKLDQLRQTILEEFPDSRLTPVPAEELERLQAMWPEAPADYIEFLRSVGAGTIGNGRFMVYSGLVEPDSIYDAETAGDLDGVILIGDDFAGYCLGYDVKKRWRLGEVDESGEFEAEEPGMTFTAWLSDFLADDE